MKYSVITMARSIQLSNGKIVVAPRRYGWIAGIVVLLFFVGCMFFIPIDPTIIHLNQTTVLLELLFTPADGKTWADYFAYAPRLQEPFLETLRMSFAGTVIGAVACLPLAILSSRNIVKTAWIYQPFRLLMNFIRTIPSLVIAIIATFFFGIGVLPGILSIAIFTFGIMTKMLYETIETVDMGPFEALEACGGNKTEAFKVAIFPQVFPIYLSYFIYNFEINVRSSVILGFVGAGGIGAVIQNNMGMFYDRVGLIIIILLVLVMVIQFMSGSIRRRLQ